MKIDVKYNIDFKKLEKEFESNKLFKTLNEGLSHKVAQTSSRYILDGKVKPVLPRTNPRKRKDSNAYPYNQVLLYFGRIFLIVLIL